ncbi:MAG: nitroreductase family protein [Rhodospirillales bacterium]
MNQRFGDDLPGPDGIDTALLASMRDRRSCRSYADRPVDDALIDYLASIALAAPSKSDLQQRDVLIVRDPALRARIDALMPHFEWLPAAPAMVIFLADHARQHRLHAMHGIAYNNDHLDGFFNASVDAAIALGAFVTAAESVGLGTCPLSVIRNHVATISEWLGLPDQVFPVAGLAVGWPADEGRMSMRLPLAETVHVDRFDDSRSEANIRDYDARRQAHDGAEKPWSLQKAEMYNKVQRADFGAHIRKIGFKLD